MTLTKNHTHIYGFEDYNIVALGDNFFRNIWSQYLPYGFDNYAGSYIINKDLPYEIRAVEDPSNYYIKNVVFTPDLCINHPELLDTAKKVYTHPSCCLSRSMMQEKYKKSLNPYLSDAVVIPNPDLNYFFLDKVALFVNENAKMIVEVVLDEDNTDVIKKVNEAEMGTPLRSFMTCDIAQHNHPHYKDEDLINSELMFVGELLSIPNGQSWAMDILTNTIPVDKIVFEKTVQESLGCETNKLDFDSLTSIRDMLNSSDENTVSAGLKALSMMDWMHYPNSIKFILSQVDDKWKWVYNKAMNATSVKFMMKSIAPKCRKRNHLPGEYDEEIYEQDYELFKQLKMHYDKVPQEKILEYMRLFGFTRDMGGVVVPILK